ncbi:hypothetical protein EMPS_11314 [Entomortierella parvispora]|uniref:Rab-GAP TBC domain-containing protein n=1 Tax=Entomortierella parvispora TaxID=205924 RepID=A0A9P3M2G0_9FUNG|nr:hypothetical protein EMPS_11314 [Entomortierella parvispora]
MDDFKELCFGGIPDKPGLRQVCWKSFVKDLIVEPELVGSESMEDDEEVSKHKDDTEWSLYFQDNKTLEQIDKDVRRTLPDFAFFQLPIPYSPLCPLSIEPQSLKSRKKAAAALRKDAEKVSPASVTTAASKVTSLTGAASHSGSAGMVEASAGTPQKGILQSISMDLKRNPGSRSMTPIHKRRQTVTLMSPRADKKQDRPTTEPDLWQSTTILSTPSTASGYETPPISMSNGYKTPNNYASPVPSRLRGMATSVEDEEGEVQELSLPGYLFSPIPTRRSLFNRVAHLNQDFGSREHQAHTLQVSKSQDNWIKKRRNKDGQRVTETDTASARGLSEESFSSLDTADSEQDQLPQDLHWEAIERVLFIYAKLNPGVGYVQGMNEILGPLYYLLANDPDEVSRAHAEAESFWLFHLLMAHFRDHFVRSLDRDRMSGIGSTIARMNFRLRQFDEDLWQNLEDKGIAPEYYSFRWLTVLCTQEFEVPDVWRIWDSVLADIGGVEKDYDFLLDFGCAMVCHLRSELVGGDFADNVKLLQNYPPVDIQPILHLATVIRDQRVSGVGTGGGLGGILYQRRQQGSLDVKEPTPRSSMDLRIWSSRSSVNENSQHHHVSSSFSDRNMMHQDMKSLTIDGVRNSDRLDHNLEGTDHRRSPLFIPLSTTAKKDKPASISGMSMDGIWSRGQKAGPVSAGPTWDRRRSSPSALSVDNYMMSGRGGRDSRPQTATWAETFSLLKARLVGSGSSLSATTEGPTANPLSSGTESGSRSGTILPDVESLSDSVATGGIVGGDFELVDEGRLSSFDSIRTDTERRAIPGECVGVLSPSVEL